MIIEVKGVGNHNKGAEMMLLTILQELYREDIRFTVAPQIGACEYNFYSRLGIYPKVWVRYKGIQLGYLGKFIPKKIRQMYSFITDDEVDVILDASGFAYSDQWGESPAKIMAEYTKRWKKKGKKIILMPQAFGPFKNKNIQRYMKEIIKNSDLIYARDDYSYKALFDIVNNAHNIKKAPDFTILLKGMVPEYFDNRKHQVCIVPNKRMIDKRRDSFKYFSVLTKIIEYLQRNEFNLFFLIHSSEDLELANEVNNRLNMKLPIINEGNPLYIKGIIKGSIGIIGSRFHALASALYSGTIAIGMGWSHKYEFLFKDFNFREGLIDLNISNEELYKTLNLLLNEKERERIRLMLLQNAEIVEKDSLNMFKEIRRFIGIEQ